MKTIDKGIINGFHVTVSYPEEVTPSQVKELRLALGRIYEKCIQEGEITPSKTGANVPQKMSA